MKFIYSILFLFPLIVSGQQIEIVSLEEPDVILNGKTVEIVGSPSELLVYKEFRVINKSGNAIDFYYQRKRVANSGALDQICDDYLCHDIPNQDNFITGVPNPTNPNDSAIFKPQIVPEGESRCAIHDYYVVSQFGTIYDSIRVKFIIGDVNCVLSTKTDELISFKVYPNPANDFLVVQLESDEKRELLIRDALGKVVIRKWVSNQEKIQISELHNGLYFASIISNTGSIESTQKLIVNQN